MVTRYKASCCKTTANGLWPWTVLVCPWLEMWS